MNSKEIEDNEAYLSAMERTFPDKAWFANALPYKVDTIVDFGCADGSFGKYLKEVLPFDFTYVGIESNPDFFWQIHGNGGRPYESLEAAAESNIIHPKRTLLVLNSVLHEVYSYADVDKFWKGVKFLSPKMIAFRDMYVGNCGRYRNAVERELEDAVEKGSTVESHYRDFTARWGRLTDGYKAVHFLLKYFYDANWSRELAEDYVPYTYRELNTRVRAARYYIHHEKFYALPYLIEKWRRDFCDGRRLELQAFLEEVTTHLRMLMVRDE